MSDVVPIFRNMAFEPEILEMMGDVYERACKQIDGVNALVKEVIAERIVQLVASGERDPAALCDRAIGLERR